MAVVGANQTMSAKWKKILSFFILLISSNCCKGNLKYFLLCVFFNISSNSVCLNFFCWIVRAPNLYATYFENTTVSLTYQFGPPETTLFVRGLSPSLFIASACQGETTQPTVVGIAVLSWYRLLRTYNTFCGPGRVTCPMTEHHLWPNILFIPSSSLLLLLHFEWFKTL
jgi:hypothetical protein